ncbi:LLM class flavin-dependent oxidoreductase [Actinomadura rugatobispora]|uniref:LLM class flavin-dependent oxidoreductase n=1 Tax=Actinomadura rugatobispora TaxID=1994 RepID=A0ABW1A897_9ACTN|nr:LLM class flavin-dependent oxidoreductase [Actinomadura rugatobispora]
MRLGAGLPTALGQRDGRAVAGWARAAEQHGFASVAVVDRLVAPTYDPLTALAGAAAVTESVDLYTSVLLAPLRPAAVLAAQAATVDRMSGGRLRLGVAVGSRRPDYEAAGVAFTRRGAILDEQLAALKATWADGADFVSPGPAPCRAGGPPVLIGGASRAAARRVAALGDGWICGLGGAEGFASGAATVLAEWRRARRDGRPHLLSVVHYALGRDAVAHREAFLRRYYGAAPFVERMIADTPVSEADLAEVLAAHREAGCDEVLLFPCSAEPGPLDALARLL